MTNPRSPQDVLAEYDAFNARIDSDSGLSGYEVQEMIASQGDRLATALRSCIKERDLFYVLQAETEKERDALKARLDERMSVHGYISCEHTMAIAAERDALKARCSKYEGALKYIAETMNWGKSTALRRSISDLQECASEALRSSGPHEQTQKGEVDRD